VFTVSRPSREARFGRRALFITSARRLFSNGGLGYDETTMADRLMNIAKLPIISNSEYIRNLPCPPASPQNKAMNLRERTAIHEAGHAAAAITFAIPIIRVTIADGRPHLHRAHYRAPDADFGLECMVTLCLAGPEAEREFCGSISDDSDRADYEMARDYLARQLNPLQVGAELMRCRDAAQRLVRSPWAQHRIVAIADALLQRGTLSSDEIHQI
jgi:hypothetical protein